MTVAVARSPTASGRRRSFALLAGMFLAAQVVIVALAVSALWLNDRIRAYSTGEGLYAKAQKQAVHALQRYADSGDPAFFTEYQRKLRVPLGDRSARIAMENEPPDREAARAGLLEGRNDPEDVPGMITVFLLFHETPLLELPVTIWRRCDALVAEMDARAEALHAAIQASPGAGPAPSELLADIYRLDREITELQDEFSHVLGHVARTIRNAAIGLLAGGSGILWLACSALGVQLNRRGIAAEAALAQRERRLRTIMDSTADGILSVAADGRIDAANLAAAQMLKTAVDELTAQPVDRIVAEDDRDEFSVALRSVQQGDLEATAGRQLIFEGLRGDGSVFPMELAFTRQDKGEGGRLIVMLRDITDRLATEARLFQAQKMEAVGQLTGGVAHDFNNLLTVISGNLEMLRDELEGSAKASSVQRYIDAALGAADRGGRVTSHLLAFSRRQPLAPTSVHIDTLINGMRELLGQTVSGALELEYRLAARGWHAMVDPVQLEAALLNLVLNARHASSDGGRIAITSRQHYVDGQTATALDLDPGEYVLIGVEDEGAGIAPENLDRVFEPFFTTRDVGEGSGLGLSMVQGFAQQSGGQVRLRSTFGQGTTVELYLPRAEAAAAAAVPATPRQTASSRARVLLVEDDPALRRVAATMLERDEYQVEAVADASAALGRLERGPVAPDLLISDVVLPRGMNGFELAARAVSLCPDLAVLMMSGFPRHSLSQADAVHYRLLQKPFTRDELLGAVVAALAGRSAART